MTDIIKNKEKWTNEKGNAFEVTSTLRLSEKINLDGHITEVSCCEQEIKLILVGKYTTTETLRTFGYPKQVRGTTVYGQIGKLMFSEKADVEKIQSVIKKTESHPAWAAKIKSEKKILEECSRMETSRKASGYCYKCGSYCYGDCE